MLAVFAWCLVAPSAVAGTPAEAEFNRLQEELISLSERNAWSGVERAFVAMQGLGLPLTPDQYRLGTEAARARGDIYNALARIQLALALLQQQDATAVQDPNSPYGQLKSLRTDLETRFGYVHVVVYPPAKAPAFARDSMPFATDESKAIEWASTRLGETQAFLGLLPGGRYTLGDQTFDVAPGAPMVEVRVGQPPG